MANSIVSILDSDLYKFTMQQAVLQHFPDSEVSYRFTNRSPSMKFNQKSFDDIQAGVARLASLALTPDEEAFLRSLPYITSEYVDFLSALRLNPSSQVDLSLENVGPDGLGELHVGVRGKWVETILYEVQLMAIISEAYFTHVDTDWSYEGQEELARQKARELIQGGLTVSEFGTRRRRSRKGHEIVIRAMTDEANKLTAEGATGKLAGTSNVHFAHLLSIPPVGTVAHEWTMGIAALRGYRHANAIALQLWEQTYPNHLLIALTDTFTTKPFWEDFKADPERVKRWQGLRQDSGDPTRFAEDAKKIYQEIGVDTKTKTIVYSDSLNTQRCFELHDLTVKRDFNASFGVGTFLTNDYKKLSDPSESSKPLNIVIKLASIDGRECIKLSDDLTKTTGNPEVVKKVKRELGIPDA